MKKDDIRALVGFTGNMSEECTHHMCNAPVCPVDSNSLVNCYTLPGEKYCPVALDIIEGKNTPAEISEAVHLNMAAWRANVGEAAIARRLDSRDKVRKAFGKVAA